MNFCRPEQAKRSSGKTWLKNVAIAETALALVPAYLFEIRFLHSLSANLAKCSWCEQRLYTHVMFAERTTTKRLDNQETGDEQQNTTSVVPDTSGPACTAMLD